MKDEHRLDANLVVINTLMTGVILALIGLAVLSPGEGILHFHFNPFVLLSATTFVVNVSLLIYLLRKTGQSDERTWLVVYLLSLVVYAFSEVMQRLSAVPSAAWFWNNVSDAGIATAPALYLFVLSFTNRTGKRYPGTIALLFILSLLFVFLLAGTNFVFPNAGPNNFTWHPWGLDYTVGPNQSTGAGVILDALWFFFPFVLSIIRLASFRRHERSVILRKQSFIFILAISIPFIGGIMTDVILPLTGLNIPPLSVALTTPSAILLIYGVIKYQLLVVDPTLFAGTILSTVQESVAVTDDKFHILYLNAKAESLLGTKNGHNDVPLVRYMTQDSAANFATAFRADFAKDKAIDLDRVDITGSTVHNVPVRVNSSPARIGSRFVRVIALTDITNEIRTQEIIEHEVTVRTNELNKARAYLVSSINSLEQGFMLVDANSAVELANGVANHLFQFPEGDQEGVPLVHLTQNMDWDINLAEIVQKVLASRHHRQVQAETKDGSFYEVYVTPVLSGSRELGATVILQNITEQKVLDRGKDEFFSIASHELRTPLTAIRGNMSMLEDYFPDAMKDKALADMIGDTHAASIRLIEIVNDFLDSSRLEQGKMVFTIHPMDVGPAVEAVMKDLSPVLRARNNTVRYEGFDNVPQVEADQDRYKQIVYNLVSNASKYSSNSTITLTIDYDAKYLTLHVADQGKGVSVEGQKLLFRKFQQAGKSMLTRDDTKGTGLGLYISKLLAKQMRGDVLLERTEEGSGSIFAVKIPLVH